MKKKLLSLSLCLCLALPLAIPAYAVDAGPVITDEQYQRYIEIANEIGNRENVEVSVLPVNKIDKAYTDEEFAAEVEELCNAIQSLRQTSSITPYSYYSNPSDPGSGKKHPRANTAINLADGAFIWTVTGYADVLGDRIFSLGTVRIDDVALIIRPSDRFECVRTPGKADSYNGVSPKKNVIRYMDIITLSGLSSQVQIVARFNMKENGSVTMTVNAV
ncbi:MAG: hypothetical protein HFF00_01920 [Ruminiclostridium sp.]|jgi:hypothetical protein|nr:hypothetical protein [Ruminiclostridium sp.]